MTSSIEDLILSSTKASAIIKVEEIQSLWSGYGTIFRAFLEGGDDPQVVVKQIKFPNQINHPRGWSNNFAHQRKVKSYEVEFNWYQNQVSNLIRKPRMPRYIAHQINEDERILIMEDLASSDFLPQSSISFQQAEAVVEWLANFHGSQMQHSSEGLWEKGSYWQVATRPEEWKVMKNQTLKENAFLIDEFLHETQYKTIIHGDAKLANFCFNGYQVAAVDFQYVGEGCGMTDLAYFLGSVYNEEELEQYASSLLNHYFETIQTYFDDKASFHDFESDHRQRYPFAWADFERFLNGWAPNHYKLSGYSSQQTNIAIDQLLNRREV